MLYTGCFAQLCLTLHDPMDCSLPGSFVHGIFQVRILDGLPFPPPGDLPNSGIELASPELAGRFFTTKPLVNPNISPDITKMSLKYHSYLTGHMNSIVILGKIRLAYSMSGASLVHQQ